MNWVSWANLNIDLGISTLRRFVRRELSLTSVCTANSRFQKNLSGTVAKPGHHNWRLNFFLHDLLVMMLLTNQRSTAILAGQHKRFRTNLANASGLRCEMMPNANTVQTLTCVRGTHMHLISATSVLTYLKLNSPASNYKNLTSPKTNSKSKDYVIF